MTPWFGRTASLNDAGQSFAETGTQLLSKAIRDVPGGCMAKGIGGPPVSRTRHQRVMSPLL
ncbi:hypothetical protein CBM2589_U10231 [Cupriavidus taiwanensis]|uniref:Uncharacterized protein n=1 Tax=Cupriavidus taiwanensis TaxID=164546 RepID=A0A375CQM3_9BURK|nr:hypothetical protein CBM2589_U10231 [Cupriavidus taiwanensis]